MRYAMGGDKLVLTQQGLFPVEGARHQLHLLVVDPQNLPQGNKPTSQQITTSVHVPNCHMVIDFHTH